MRILMVTNRVMTYALGFQNVLDVMMELGHEVVWAANFSTFTGNWESIPCKTENICITSNPLNKVNHVAYKQLKRIIKEENIEVIYCSTPIGGLLGRLAGHSCKVKKVIYAAHGFLFFKGTPLINKTAFRWEEQFLARYTDVLITINEEDFEQAKIFKLKAGGQLYIIHGAGVEVGKAAKINRAEKRRQLGLSDRTFIITSAGYLNKNKNNRIVIEAVAKLKGNCLCYVICGDGEKETELKNLAVELGVQDKVLFLGFRTDLLEILAVSDCFVMPSFREGVPRALLEAMDTGIPCVGSRTRGISELIGNGTGGYLCNPNDSDEFVQAFEKIMLHPEIALQMASRNRDEAKRYSKEIVRAELRSILEKELQ